MDSNGLSDPYVTAELYPRPSLSKKVRRHWGPVGDGLATLCSYMNMFSFCR
jgi:hypothetical protein